MRTAVAGKGSSTVAVEASALRRGTHEASAFVEFILGALGEEGTYATSVWSLRRLRGSTPAGHGVRRRVFSPLAGRVAAMGAALPARWAAPAADVLHLASGPRPVRVAPPGVITVHGPELDRTADGSSGPQRKATQLLRRAADEGVVIHAVTDAVADALVEQLGVDRSSIAVVHPGIRIAHDLSVELTPPARPPAVDVLAGTNEALDAAVLRAINESGVATAALVGTRDQLRASCAVIASPEPGFPTRAFEALAAGIPVVTARTATCSSLLAGAVRFVDAGSVVEFSDAALDLATNASERSIAIAAGRVRALDFDWRHRVGDLVALYRRAALAS